MIKSILWDGQKVTKPGMYSNMPLEEYHRGDICDGPSVSSTSLRNIFESSPRHFWATSGLNPKRAPQAEKKAFILGRAAHHLLCGQDKFAKEYVVRPKKAPDGRVWHASNLSCIEWLKEQKKLGLTILTMDQVEKIRKMATELHSQPLIKGGLLSGLIERSFFWRDDETGLWLKARPDAIPTDGGDFGDLKTTPSVLYLDIQKSLGEWGYCQQAGLVLEGANALGMETESFSLVWIETEEPHCSRISTLQDEDLARGIKMNRVAMRMISQCYSNWLGSKSDEAWPGPAEKRPEAEYLQLPEWKRRQIDNRLEHNLREYSND